jgi:very-short-patch-repair endonuclease
MNKRNIVIGCYGAEKRERAKELRQTMTPPEKILWDSLRTGQLAGLHFRRQQILDGFIVDFYCHKAGVVIELDGPIHQQQEDYDREREKIIAARELKILRFSNERIENDLNSVLAEIQSAAQEQIVLQKQLRLAQR